jgi:phenylacetate-CoA ligase
LLAEYLISQQRPAPALTSAITTAESLTPEERTTIEGVLQCPTFDRYGCREFSVVASQCEARDGLHIAAETFLVEFLVDGRHAEPGEPGAIIITDLLNEATPFIRYRIGDIGAPMAGQCSCGRGLPRMEMVAGRITDFIHTADGRWISGVAINTYLISQLPGVRQAQIVQDTCDHLRFRLVPLPEGCETVRKFLSERVPGIFGPAMTHEIEWVDQIAPEPSGKTLVTVSRCGHLHGFGESPGARKGEASHAAIQ